MFISPKYAKEFKKYLDEKKAKDINNKLDKIMKFAGSMQMEDRYVGLTDKELRKEVAKAKCGL